MGRTGLGVAFEAATDEADRTASAFPMNVYAQAAETLGSLVDEVVEAEVVVGLAMARRVRAIERARKFSEAAAADPALGTSTASSRDMARRSFVCEIAAALHIPDRTAENLIWTSRTLVTDLHETLIALSEGRLGFRHAQVLVDNSYSLDAASVAALEAGMLPVAEKTTAAQFERRVRKARERLNPESMVHRQVLAESERSVTRIPEKDGMVSLVAYLPAAQGVAIDNRLTEIARSLQGAEETRTLTQLRADIFSDILLDTDADADEQDGTRAGRGDGPIRRYAAIRPRVLVTVPAMTLLRRSTEPGILEGYGPIDPQSARELTGNAKVLYRLLTDPHTGVVLALGRRRYKVSEGLRTWLRVRDGTCRFPGCSRAAARCDLDHTQDWYFGGASDHDNLAHLCPGHHALKHATGWTVEHTSPGQLRWTSPAGNSYDTEPETRMHATA